MKNLVLKLYRYRQGINRLKLSRPAIIHPTAKFAHHDKIQLGRYTRIGANCHLNGEGGIQIHEGSILGPGVTILSSSHSYDQEDYIPYGFSDHLRPVLVGKGCWIGANAMIVPGVKLGDGVVVAMGAVVSRNVPSGAIVAGNPAIVVKMRNASYKQLINTESYFLKGQIENGLSRSQRRNKGNSPYLMK